MALFTTTDRDNIKAALVTLAVEGVATVSVGNQSVTTHDIQKLYDLLAMVQADLAGDDATEQVETRMGMRMVKTIPPSSG